MSCGWFYSAINSSSRSWIRVAAVLSSDGWIRVATVSSSDGWIRVAADSILRLTWVSVAGYELRLRFNGSLEFRRLDASYSWLRPTADPSSSCWIRLEADSFPFISSPLCINGNSEIPKASCFVFCKPSGALQNQRRKSLLITGITHKVKLI